MYPVMSPVSAYMTLGMVAEGAKGTTKKEFDKVLGSSSLALAESMMQTLPQKNDAAKLTIANSAWMDQEFIWNKFSKSRKQYRQ